MRIALALLFLCGTAAADVSVRVPDAGGDCRDQGKRVETVDINGDGKPDVWKLYAGERLVCEKLSFDFSGQVQEWRHFDPRGRIALEELDLDGDGLVDLRKFYKDGKLIRSERRAEP